MDLFIQYHDLYFHPRLQFIFFKHKGSLFGKETSLNVAAHQYLWVSSIKYKKYLKNYLSQLGV